jgi:hypothetical protein
MMPEVFLLPFIFFSPPKRVLHFRFGSKKCAFIDIKTDSGKIVTEGKKFFS